MALVMGANCSTEVEVPNSQTWISASNTCTSSWALSIYSEESPGYASPAPNKKDFIEPILNVVEIWNMNISAYLLFD